MAEQNKQRPYGKVSPEERQRKTLELLAKHAAQWETQAQTFEQTSKIKTKTAHKSVMFMDHQWREKQRQLAKAEQDQKRNQQLSWVHSLRFNERLIELKLGRVNPITCVRSASDQDYAVNAVINMPEYIPVDQRIPPEMLAKKNEQVEAQILKSMHESKNEPIDLPIDIDLVPSRRTSFVDGDKTVKKRPSQAQLSEKRQSIAAVELESLAREIEKQQIVHEYVPSYDPLRSNKINKEVFEEPYIFIDMKQSAQIQINSINLTFVEDSPAELTIKNTGDCLVSMELRNKDLRVIKRQLGTSNDMTSSKGTAPIQTIATIDTKRESTHKTLPTGSKVFETQNHKLNTLSMLNGKATTTYAAYLTKKNDFGEKPAVQQNIQPQATLEINQKLREKADTPAHLKILAERYGHLEQKKLIISNYNSRIDIPCGETAVVKFFMPSKVNNNAGSISQEYDLILTPPVKINVDDGQQHDAKTLEGSTYVTITCNGVNSNVFGTYKELHNHAARGIKALEHAAVVQRCLDLVWEFADQVVNGQENSRREAESEKMEQRGIVKQIEANVIKAYQNGTCQAKWNGDKERIKSFLYELHGDLIGANVAQQDICHMQQEVVKTLTGKEYEFINYEPGSKEKPLFLSLLPLQHYMNQSELSVHLQALRQTILNHHYRFEEGQYLDRYGRNLMKIINKRVINLVQHTARFTLDQCEQAEEEMIRYATSRSRGSVAIHLQMNQHPLSQRLINIVLNYCIEYLSRQLRIQNKAKQLTSSKFNQLYAPFMIGDTTKILDLVYLAAACSTFEPVFDMLEINKYGPIDDETRIILSKAKALYQLFKNYNSEASVFDEETVEYLSKQLTGANGKPENKLRDMTRLITSEQIDNLVTMVVDPEKRSQIEQQQMLSLMQLINAINYYEKQQKSTLEARHFLCNYYISNGIKTNVNNPPVEEYMKSVQIEPAAYIEQYTNIAKEAEENKAKNTKKGAKDAGKQQAGQKKQVAAPAPVQEQEQPVEPVGDSIVEFYKKCLEQAAARPASAAKNAKKGAPPPLKKLTVVNEFNGRKFSGGADLVQQLVGVAGHGLNIQETLVDIVVTALELQVFPQHSVFDISVKEGDERLMRVVQQVEAEYRQQSIEGIAQRLQAQQDLASQQGGQKKAPAKPAKGAQPEDQAELLQRQAEGIFERYCGHRCLVPTEQLVDLSAAVEREDFLASAARERREREAGDFAAMRGHISMPDLNLIDTLQSEVQLSPAPGNLQNLRGNAAGAPPEDPAASTASAVLSLQETVDFRSETAASPSMLNTQTHVLRDVQRGESGHTSPQPQDSHAGKAPLEVIAHEFRVHFFREELLQFADAVVAQHTEDACALHYEALSAYEDEAAVWERVQLAREGKLQPEELGMTAEDVATYQEPRRPHPADYFKEEEEANGEEARKASARARRVMGSGYDVDRGYVLRRGAANALKRLQEAALQNYQKVYDESTYAEVRQLIQDRIGELIAQLEGDQVPEQQLADIYKVFGIELEFRQDCGGLQKDELEQLQQTFQGCPPAGPAPRAMCSPLTRAFVAARPAAVHGADYPADNELLCAPGAGLCDAQIDPAMRDADFVDFDCQANFKAIEQLVPLPDPKKKPDGRRSGDKDAKHAGEPPQAEPAQT